MGMLFECFEFSEDIWSLRQKKNNKLSVVLLPSLKKPVKIPPAVFLRDIR